MFEKSFVSDEGLTCKILRHLNVDRLLDSLIHFAKNRTYANRRIHVLSLCARELTGLHISIHLICPNMIWWYWKYLMSWSYLPINILLFSRKTASNICYSKILLLRFLVNWILKPWRKSSNTQSRCRFGSV